MFTVGAGIPRCAEPAPPVHSRRIYRSGEPTPPISGVGGASGTYGWAAAEPTAPQVHCPRRLPANHNPARDPWSVPGSAGTHVAGARVQVSARTHDCGPYLLLPQESQPTTLTTVQQPAMRDARTSAPCGCTRPHPAVWSVQSSVCQAAANLAGQTHPRCCSCCSRDSLARTG